MIGSIFGSIGPSFGQVAQCMTVAAVTVLAVYVYYEKKPWCDKTVGRIGGKGCDTLRKVIFGALVAFLALVLLNGFSGGGYGGGYSGGYSGGGGMF